MSIVSTLFSESQARVYRWVFGQPERAFHLSELRRLTGLGSASLQRELNALVDAGLLCSERLGNLRRFQANANSPIYPELVQLTRKLLGVEPVLREALLPLASHLQGAWLYGSVAKKSDNASSDIDVLLVGKNLQLAKVLELLLPAEAQLGRKINPVCYTPAEFERRKSEKDSFVNRVLAQSAVALMGGTVEPAAAG
jgi:predicted nucleotidyltransferase